jgi:hypothetical protein
LLLLLPLMMLLRVVLREERVFDAKKDAPGLPRRTAFTSFFVVPRPSTVLVPAGADLQPVNYFHSLFHSAPDLSTTYFSVFLLFGALSQ